MVLNVDFMTLNVLKLENFKCSRFFPSQNLRLVYSFESLSLKLMHDNGVVYLTMLAPFHISRIKIET